MVVLFFRTLGSKKRVEGPKKGFRVQKKGERVQKKACPISLGSKMSSNIFVRDSGII